MPDVNAGSVIVICLSACCSYAAVTKHIGVKHDLNKGMKKESYRGPC
jgi:hypothetical protein